MFPGVTVPQAEAGKAAIDVTKTGTTAAAGGLFSAASGLLGPVGAGLGMAVGLSGMFDGGGTDLSKAVSGGTFYTGQMSLGGKPLDKNLLIIVAFILVVLFLLFRGKI